VTTEAVRAIILTGKRAVGKSTVCEAVVDLARRRGYSCAGILTLTRADARDVVDASTGQRRRLTWSPGQGPVVTQGRFRFSSDAIVWAEQLLRRALPCDLLVIDEIGPLEVERGQGWACALEVLRAGAYALALLVVRPELLSRVRELLSPIKLEVVTVTFENRGSLPPKLVECLEGEASRF